MWSFLRRKMEYPRTVSEVLDDHVEYPATVHEAMRRFRSSKPYRGGLQDMKPKFLLLNHDLAVAYAMSEEPDLVFVRRSPFGSSCCCRKINLLMLEVERDGRLSVVTYLHEFAHLLVGPDEKEACRWSINLFRKHFPRSYGRLVPVGHLLTRKELP